MRTRTGGTVTFEEFLDAELDGLDRFSRVLTGDRQRAHDCLADSLIKVQIQWKHVAAMEMPLAYVRRVVTNTFLDERRSWAHRMLHLVGPDDLPEQAHGSTPVSGVDDRAHLHDLLARLPRRQRAAIVMRHYLDLSDAEIAEVLSCSAASVRTNVSRGLAALRLLPTTADGLHDHAAPALPSSGHLGKGRS